VARKPSTAPDGQSDEEASGTKTTPDTSVVHDLLHLRGKDALSIAQALKDAAKSKYKGVRSAVSSRQTRFNFSFPLGGPIDDHNGLLLEHIVALLQGLPANSGLGHTLSDGLIKVRE
jgi:hypothetical protein